MSIVKIKTSHTSSHGREVILGKHKVSFDKQGNSEVEDYIFNDISLSYPEIQLAETPAQKMDAIRAELKAQKMPELLQLAKDAELPEEEYKDKNKTDLIEYLITKI